MAEDRKKSLKWRQPKGNTSAITDGTPIKLYVHNLIMVIYSQYKFHEILSIIHRLPSHGWVLKKSLKFRQSKGNNSAITDDTQIKLHLHNLTIAIYIQYKFHEVSSIGYLVMAEDRKSDGRTEGWTTPV